MMKTQRIWSDSRRRIMAKTVFDIFKIETAAAFASKFFADSPTPAKVFVIFIMLLTMLGGFIMYPLEGD